MPSLTASLDGVLNASTFTSGLNEQIGALSGVVETVVSLISNPPQEIGDLSAVLGEFPLPNLDVVGDIAETLGSLSDLLPSDITSITGGLTSGLESLQTTVGTDLVEVLNATLGAALAIYQLTQIDLTCSTGTSTNGTGIPGGGNGSSPGGGGTATPAPAAESTVTQINTALDLFPTPITVEGLLTFIHSRLKLIDRDILGPIRIPLLDDLRDPLDTLVTWKDATPADMLANIIASLTDLDNFLRAALDVVLNDLLADIQALSLPTVILNTLATDIIARLSELRTAVQNGNVSGTGTTVTVLNGLLEQYEALTLPNAELQELTVRLRALPHALEDQMGYVLSILEPDSMLNLLQPLTSVFSDSEAAITGLGTFLDTIVAWFQDLIDMIDLSALQQPLTAVSDGARAAVDELDNSMVAVTMEVQNLFSDVNAALDAIDPTAVTQSLEDAVNTFKDEVIGQLQALFEPARQAVETAVAQIDSAVDGFDPEAIVQSLEEAMDAIKAVLEDPTFTAVVQKIRQTLESVAQALEELSFAVIIDEVIKGIETVSDGVQSAVSAGLSPILEEALKAALSFLPPTITPVIDPLITNFGELVESGPIPLLDAIKDQPKQILDQVRAFDPAAAIGDTLTQPFNEIIEQMDAFKPSSLLAPLHEELDRLKERLRENANPGQFLEPLEDAFEQVQGALDQFNPSELIEPLDQSIQQVVDSIIAALPVDEAFDQVDAVLLNVQQILAYGNLIKTTADKAKAVLAGFSDPQAQLTAWLDPILNKLAGDAAINPLLANITGAVDSLRASGLQTRIDAPLTPILADLASLDPQAKLTAIVQSHLAINIAALPDSPEKLAIVAVLNRMNPLQPSFDDGFEVLIGWQDALTETQTSLQALFATWDSTYFGVDSALVSLSGLQANGLRDWVDSVIEPLVTAPLAGLLALLPPLGQLITVFSDELDILIDSLQSKIGDVLTGPNSLTAIRDSIQELIDRLDNFNLDFLQDAINSVFDNVKSKLNALSPAALGEVLNQVFDELLDTLNLDPVLPQAMLDALDDTYNEVVEKLKQLSPAEIVEETVNPLYQETIVPLVEVFDVSEIINTILERLHALDDELREELTRVDSAYQSMLQSVSSAGVSISASV